MNASVLFLTENQYANAWPTNCKHALEWHNKPQYDGVTHFLPEHFQSLFFFNGVETKMLMNN